MNVRLCNAFQELARQTADNMRNAFKYKMPWNEETNTESILLNLVSNHSQYVRVKTFSKIKESKNGADWEWWFVDHHRQFGLPMRIQAKRIHPDTGTFDSLFHPKNTKSQMRTLLRQAKCDNMFPAYVFYTYLKDTRLAAKLIDLATPSGWDDIFGCLFSPASDVAEIGSKSIADLQNVCRPWHELVCGCALSSRSESKPSQLSLPDRVREFLQSSESLGIAGKMSADTIGKSMRDVPMPRELPSYVRWVASGDYTAAEIDEPLFGDARVTERGIQGIVVVIEPESYAG